MKNKFNYKFLGTINISKILPIVENITEEEWNEYDFRQRAFGVHRHTKTIPLIFGIFQGQEEPEICKRYYPKFEKFLKEVENIIQKPITSCMMALLPAHQKIKTHVDAAPFFEEHRRIHLPLITNSEVVFTIADETKNMKAGEIWEINNNQKRHGVINNGSEDRIHLIIDVEY